MRNRELLERFFTAAAFTADSHPVVRHFLEVKLKLQMHFVLRAWRGVSREDCVNELNNICRSMVDQRLVTEAKFTWDESTRDKLVLSYQLPGLIETHIEFETSMTMQELELLAESQQVLPTHQIINGEGVPL